MQEPLMLRPACVALRWIWYAGGHTHSSVSGTSGSVAYIQPAAQAQAYAYAELSFNEAGSVSVTTETTRSVSDASCYSTASGLDAEVLSISKAAVAAVSGELNTVLGYITSSITNTRTSAGNFICDLMNSATGSQAAFTNSGGVRTSFTVSGESRNVTMADIYTMMPFCNMLYVFKVSYFELSQAVANKSLYMSGVDAYFSGNALTALVVNDKCIYKDGAWADGWKTADVLVSVNEYVATGYNPFKDWISEGKAIDTTSYVDNVTFIAELQKQTAQTGGLISVDNTLHTIYGAYSGSLYTGKPTCEHKYIATVTGPTCTEQGYTTYTCALCGDTYRADYTPALGHNYVQTGKTEPSGSTDGSVTYTCSRCGDTYSQRIPAAGYTVTTICTGGSITPAQNAAYGQSVTISYEPDSGKVLSKLLVDGTEIKLYTTDEYGVNHYCFLTQYTFTGLSANHTIEAVFAAPETQAEPCTLSTSCSAGGKISAGGTLAPMQTISVLLTPDDGYYISAVTINGMQADIAERYDFSYTPGKMLTIDARFASLSGHVHSYTAVVTPPTCTEGGYTTYTCVCGDSYRAEETAALGHDYVEKELSHAATCETQSRILYTCSRCGASYTELRTEPCPSAKFTDVDTTRWYHYGIDYVTSCGMMAGVGNDKFEPNGTLTRAMLVTILYRLENQPDMTGYESPFTDVPSGQYYTNAVLWAQVYGIVSGVSENKFAPNVKITREQIAAILYKYTCMKNKEEIKPTVSLQTFKDAGRFPLMQ
jgi:hypothetical protein